jgi:hypothetical protein
MHHKKHSIVRRPRILWILALPAVLLSFARSGLSPSIPTQEASPLEGRWDLTLQGNGKSWPSWLEVSHSGTHTLVGQFVGIGGSARPISRVEFSNSQLHFSIPPQWESGTGDLVVDGKLSGDDLSGILTAPDGKKIGWTGHRAPALRRSAEPVWGSPITLFDGTDLTGWHAMGTNQWVAESGLLRSPHSGSNIVTDAKFTDFKLHIEFRYPAESNSGVYLRGRYEVQIEDSKGKEPLKDLFSAIYGFIAPSEMTAKAPGEWQTYDITLIGRMVSVVANGVQVICNREIPGITGGALDSKEGEPGPIYLQGDHGPVDFRNIVLTPAQ